MLLSLFSASCLVFVPFIPFGVITKMSLQCDVSSTESEATSYATSLSHQLRRGPWCPNRPPSVDSELDTEEKMQLLEEAREAMQNQIVKSEVMCPRWKQDVKCAYCKEWGHHIDNCIKAFVARVRNVDKHCQHDRHDPYRHGNDWRCNNCGCHMSERTVSYWYPRKYAARKA